jgi:hypothetical protein
VNATWDAAVDAALSGFTALGEQLKGTFAVGAADEVA